MGKYKTKIDKIDKKEKIPENNFAKCLLTLNILEKNEMNKKENENKFDFPIEKYISPEI